MDSTASTKWEFDASVTAVFDDMLARSIPQYEVMRNSVFDLGARFVQPQTAIVDLGASRGEALQPFIDRFGAYNRFVAVEISPPMLAACRQRFQGMMQCGIVTVEELDLRKGYPAAMASVTLSVLTLQFTPIEYRQRIVADMYRHTTHGGAVILVEKLIGSSHLMNEQFMASYYALKGANGYSQDEIERKRLSLEGVLVPVTARWNEELLSAAGFKYVECFWRWMNFAGWLAVKE